MLNFILFSQLSVLKRAYSKINLKQTPINRDVTAAVQKAISIRPLVLRTFSQSRPSHHSSSKTQEEITTVLSPLPSSLKEVASAAKESVFSNEILAGRQNLRKVSVISSDPSPMSPTGKGQITDIPPPPPLPPTPKCFSSAGIPPPPPLPPTPKIRSEVGIPPPSPLLSTVKTVSKREPSSRPPLPPKPKSFSTVGIPLPSLPSVKAVSAVDIPPPPPVKATSAVGVPSPPPPPPLERAISAMDIPSPLSCQQKINSPSTPLFCVSKPFVNGDFTESIIEGKKKLKKVVVKKPEEGVGRSKPDQNLSLKDSIIRDVSCALSARRRVMYSDDDDDDDNDDDDDDDDDWN